MTNPSNPNGANQYQLDPRQQLLWESYANPSSDTFGNALQSAIKAGYTDAYATQITATEWFVDKVRRLNMLSKAEKVLDKTLTYDVVGDYGIVKTDLARIQVDVAKHVTKTLGKEHYSERIEQTGKDGLPLQENSSLDDIKDITNKLNDIYRGTSQPGDGTASDPLDKEIQD